MELSSVPNGAKSCRQDVPGPGDRRGDTRDGEQERYGVKRWAAGPLPVQALKRPWGRLPSLDEATNCGV